MRRIWDREEGFRPSLERICDSSNQVECRKVPVGMMQLVKVNAVES